MDIMTNIAEVQQQALQRHQEVLDMIERLTDAASSDGVSLVWKSLIPWSLL
jgi:hypothetical protein